jgi:hypothetical protein
MFGRIKSAKPAVAVSVGVVALLVIGGGSAAAKALITGSDIKDGTVTGADVKDHSLHLRDLGSGTVAKLQGAKGAKGDTGAKGAKGDKGDKGDAGADAAYVGADWSIVDRNVIGNGDSYLRAGPDGGTGQGSLGLRTGDAADKAAFGNQTGFTGDAVSDLTHVGYSVFTTSENNDLSANNMPSISIEIDPNVIGSGNFSTLLYAPDNSAAGQWTDINAVTDTGKHWGLTGGFFNDPATMNERCGFNGSRCTFQEVQAYLANNNNSAQGSAKIGAVSITKGRDWAFSGAVDNLRINNAVFDFEPFGVVEHGAP